MSEAEDLVRRILDDWARGDFRSSARLLAPDVVAWWEEPPQEIVCHGPAEVAARFRDFLRNWSDFRLEPEQVTELRPGVVLVVGRQSSVGRVSGARVDERAYLVWGVRQGMIARMTWSFDRARSLAAFDRDLGPPGL